MDCTICVAKAKAQISCVIIAQLICAFVYAYAKSQFSHVATPIRCWYSLEVPLSQRDSKEYSELTFYGELTP